jgi:hypothetical protein
MNNNGKRSSAQETFQQDRRHPTTRSVLGINNKIPESDQLYRTQLVGGMLEWSDEYARGMNQPGRIRRTQEDEQKKLFREKSKEPLKILKSKYGWYWKKKGKELNNGWKFVDGKGTSIFNSPEEIGEQYINDGEVIDKILHRSRGSNWENHIARDYDSDSDATVLEGTVAARPLEGASRPYQVDTMAASSTNIQWKPRVVSPASSSDGEAIVETDFSQVVHDLRVSGMSGGTRTQEDILARVSNGYWQQGGNYMPYGYLKTVLENQNNEIYIGKLGEEVVSIFSFRGTGRGQRDTTITLLWTKGSHRRKGFAKILMQRGIHNLLDDSCILSGTNPTNNSCGLFQNLDFGRTDAGYCIGVNKLRRILQLRASSRTENVVSGGMWETKIRLLDADDDDNDIPTDLIDERNQWRQGHQEPVIDLTGVEDNDATVDVIFLRVVKNDPESADWQFGVVDAPKQEKVTIDEEGNNTSHLHVATAAPAKTQDNPPYASAIAATISHSRTTNSTVPMKHGESNWKRSTRSQQQKLAGTTFHGTSTLNTPADKKKEQDSRFWWTCHLIPSKWETFSPSAAYCQDWGFVPVQYLSQYKIEQVKKFGTRGIHFAIGWIELYDLLRANATFDGEDFIITYNGPPFEIASTKNIDKETTSQQDEKTAMAADATPAESSETCYPPNPPSSISTNMSVSNVESSSSSNVTLTAEGDEGTQMASEESNTVSSDVFEEEQNEDDRREEPAANAAAMTICQTQASCRQSCLDALRRLADQGKITSEQKRYLVLDIILCKNKEQSAVENAYEILYKTDSYGGEGRSAEATDDEFAELCPMLATILKKD